MVRTKQKEIDVEARFETWQRLLPDSQFGQRGRGRTIVLERLATQSQQIDRQMIAR
jgi:hypothetical protein